MFPSLTRDEVFRIETRRCWLRWPRAEDASRLASWVGRPDVATMTSMFRIGITADEIKDVVASNRQSNTDGRSLSFVLVRKGREDTPIGRVGVGLRPGGSTLELGYHLDPEFWGSGLMTEAVKALTAQAFELSAQPSIEAFALPQNIGSIRVLEKTGFTSVGMAVKDSPVFGIRELRHFTLPRARPSALRTAQSRFQPVPQLGYQLVGFV